MNKHEDVLAELKALGALGPVQNTDDKEHAVEAECAHCSKLRKENLLLKKALEEIKQALQVGVDHSRAIMAAVASLSNFADAVDDEDSDIDIEIDIDPEEIEEDERVKEETTTQHELVSSNTSEAYNAAMLSALKKIRGESSSNIQRPNPDEAVSFVGQPMPKTGMASGEISLGTLATVPYTGG